MRGETGPYTTERRYVRKDGRRMWAKLSVSLVRKTDGEPDYFAYIVEDITEHKLEELVPEPLTNREMKILQLIARWRTNTEIAQDIGYSIGTIKSDVQNILTKLGTQKDRRQAAARAIEIGLIDPHDSRNSIE